MKNGHSKDPDWGKFGLEDGEKQPLNPGSSAAEQAKPVNGEKGLFGGQVIDDNELFADDQVRYFPSISYYFHIPKHFLNFFPHTGKNTNRRKSNLLP